MLGLYVYQAEGMGFCVFSKCTLAVVLGSAFMRMV